MTKCTNGMTPFCIFFLIADFSPYGNIYFETADNISGQINTMNSVMAHI